MQSGKDVLGDYDFSRNDRFFSLKIPTYQIISGVVYYQLTLVDLMRNQTYTSKLRFKEIKSIHDSLSSKNFELPPFPKKNFWTKTNNNPQLIEKRRASLQNYLNIIINDPFLRGNKQIKRVVQLCKQQNKTIRKLSIQITEQCLQGRKRRVKSCSGHTKVVEEDWSLPKLKKRNLTKMNSIL